MLPVNACCYLKKSYVFPFKKEIHFGWLRVTSCLHGRWSDDTQKLVFGRHFMTTICHLSFLEFNIRSLETILYHNQCKNLEIIKEAILALHRNSNRFRPLAKSNTNFYIKKYVWKLNWRYSPLLRWPTSWRRVPGSGAWPTTVDQLPCPT